MFISTTSIGGLVAFPLGSTYHATKWALEGWSESLAFELNTLGIDIKTVSRRNQDGFCKAVHWTQHPVLLMKT